MEFEVESHLEGRPIPQITSLIVNQVGHPFTHACLEFSMSSVVWTYDTFEINFGINHNFENYLKEICWICSDQPFSFKYFLKIP